MGGAVALHFDIAEKAALCEIVWVSSMPTLRQLNSSHRTLLLLDSSSTNLQVGLLERDHEPLWSVRAGEAGEQLFAAVQDVLARARATIGDIEAFVFCDGPGSVLGIRTAAVALRTWNVLRARPCHRYCSLALLAHSEALRGRRGFSVVSDARRETWHRVQVNEAGTLGRLQRVGTAELSGPLLMPDGFRAWSKIDAPITTVPYELAPRLAQLCDVELFAPTDEPDAFLHEEPVYQMWTPQVHRAPSTF